VLRRPHRGRSSGPDWLMSVDLCDDWYPLPLDRDATEFASYVVEVIVDEAPAVMGHALPVERAEAIAAEFAAMTALAQETSAYAAALYRPVYDGPTVAMTQTHVFDGGTGDLRSWVEELLAADPSERPASREVTERALTAGTAIRVHEVSGPSADLDEAPVVESVAHYVRVPGGELVRMTTSWTTIASPDLVALADDVAASLSFR
jgi:hypothetical protein